MFKLESGAINSAGSLSSSTTRFRTISAIKVKKGTKIKVINNSYLFNYFEYNSATQSTETFLYTSNAFISEHTVKNDNVYIGLSFKNVNDAEITDIPNVNDIISVVFSGENVIVNKENLSEDIILKLKRGRNSFMHISFDDVEYCFKDLAINLNTYTSVFDNAFLAKLKLFHEKYDACFSLYCFHVDAYNNITDKFASEFLNASEWLKIGYHSGSSGISKIDYDNFVTNIFRITGGINSLDRVPRLHGFSGTLEQVKELRDTECGIIGLLSTDDSRQAYFLSENQNAYLRKHAKLIDTKSGIVFYSTSMRLDWFVPGFTSNYEYNIPVKDNVYDELAYRYSQPAIGDVYSHLEVFTHEWQVYSKNGNILPNMDLVDQACRFGYDYRYTYNYSQNIIDNGISSILIS